MNNKPTYKELEKKIQTLEARHQRRLVFEQLLSELMAVFVNIAPGEVDAKVEEVLQRIGKVIHVDRTDIAQLDSAKGLFRITNSWRAPGFDNITSIAIRRYFPWMEEQLLKYDAPICFTTPEDLPPQAVRDKRSLVKFHIKSGVIIPYWKNDRFIASVSFGCHNRYVRSWPQAMIQRLQLLGEVLLNALFRKQADEKLCHAFKEIADLKDLLQNENIYLRDELKTVNRHHEIIGPSKAISEVIRNIRLVAKTSSTVLISGETGTGKELVARAIHKESARRKHSMITVNCAALPASLVESELFGREKGAYTGAQGRQIGRFEMAKGSTLFLDEIGEIPKDVQVKLLRVLQFGEFERLGGNKTIKVDVRIVTATNRDLLKEVEKGMFREDLYYRLNVFPVSIPPLRERPDDILPLTRLFIEEFNLAMGKKVENISRTSHDALHTYSWPGNVRELKNIIERAMISNRGKTLTVIIPEATSKSINLPMAEYERTYMLKILEKTGWRIRGKNGAAEILDLKPTTLYSRMKKYGIKRPV